MQNERYKFLVECLVPRSQQPHEVEKVRENQIQAQRSAMTSMGKERIHPIYLSQPVHIEKIYYYYSKDMSTQPGF
jgi:hypothetical protein